MKKHEKSPNDVTPVHYLPRTLVDYWSVHPENASPIWGKWLSGSLMHCDITGFTAMSETLGELGREGAEFMATILNQFFERMLGIAEQWDGVQMKFGGDAMLLLFAGPTHAQDAARCASEMQTAMKEFRRVTVMDTQHPLKMRIGIHSGHFYSASVGQADGHLHYMLFGVDVNRTALVEPHASPGQVVTSEETAGLIRDSFSVIPTRVHGIWRVKLVDEAYQHQVETKTPPVIRDILKRYLLPPIAQGQVSNLAGEHRRVTAVFVNILGASELLSDEDEATALTETNKYLSALITTIERYGGYLAASDVSEVGEKLLILFGAPVSLDKQEEKALLFIDAFNRRLAEVGSRLRHKLGVNSGFVFAGEIGSKLRKEYTVIGDSVNLAARLMGKANMGDTIVSAATATRGGDIFSMKKKRAIRVKGKSEAISIFQYLGVKEESQGTVIGKAFFAGRKSERQKITKQLNAVRRGTFNLLHVYGEPGIGKTGLCRKLTHSLQGEGWVSLEGHGQSYLMSTPFSIWIQPLKALFAILPDDDEVVALERIRLVMSDLVPEYKGFYLLVAEMLSVKFVNDEIMDALDPRERHEKRLEIIPELLRGLSQYLPVLLFLDNYQWIDKSSRELLDVVARSKPANLMIMVSSRYPDSGLSEEVRRDISLLHLKDLHREDAKEIVRYYSLNDDEKRINEIIKKAKGNPLFLKELAEASSQGTGELPATINDVIMVKMDNLDQRARGTLRLAAVIGNEFERDTLYGLMEQQHAEKYLQVDLQALIEAGFLNVLNEQKRFQFSNNLSWEVVYETLLYADRREIHRRVVKYLEITFSEDLAVKAGALAYHNDRAGNNEQAMYYTAIAGDNAAKFYAVNDAQMYYQKALVYLRKLNNTHRVEQSAIQEKIADIAAIAGQNDDAIKALKKGLKLWQESKKRKSLRHLPWKIKSAERSALLCRKLSEAYRDEGNYKASLNWAQKGLEELPSSANNVRSQLFSAMSGTLFRKGDLKESIDWAEKARKLSRRLKHKVDLARSSKMVANVYMWEGRFADAIKVLEEAADIYQELGDLPGIASTNGNLGVCTQLRGELDRASRHYSDALTVYEQLQNKMQVAIVSNNQGEVLLTRGDIDRASENLSQTVEICLRKNSELPLAGLALVNLSRCMLYKQDYAAAESYLKKGIRILREAGAEQLLMEAKLQQVENNIQQKMFSSARRKISPLVRDLKRLESRVLMSRAFRLLAGIDSGEDKSLKAMDNIERSIEIAREIGAKHELAKSLVVQAELMSSMGDKIGGEKGLFEAVDLFTEMGAFLEAQQASTRITHISK